MNPQDYSSEPQKISSAPISNSRNELYEFGPFRLHAAQRLLTRNGEAFTLAPKTFDLLALLTENQGRVLTKQELLRSLWPDTFVEEANLSFQVSALRRALGEEGIAWIDTLPKHGYRFTAPVTRVAGNGEPAVPSPAAPSFPRPQGRIPWALVSAVMTVIAAIGWVFAWREIQPVDHALVRLTVNLGPDALLTDDALIGISPDGTRIVFLARGAGGRQQLATRLLSQAQTTLLPETQNGRELFFSPDGQWIGFFAEGKLKKIPVQGGASVDLCNAVYPGGGAWGEDGTIAASPLSLSGLWRISSAGGRPQPLTRLGPGELVHRWPQWLPGGEAVLFTANTRGFGFDDAAIQVLSLKSGQIKTLLRGGYRGRYLPVNRTSGALVYIHQGMLFGVPFDAARLEIRGAPIRLIEDLAVKPTTGEGQFGFSKEGALVYLAGKAEPGSWPVVWLDRSGKTQPLLSTPGNYAFPRFSPDGRRLALTRSANDNEIIVYDWERDRMSRLPFGQHAFVPIWSPDGKHIVFNSTGSAMGLWWIRSDGSAEAQPLLETHVPTIPYSFSPDGKWLAYHATNPETAQDLWTVPLDVSDPEHPKAGKPEVFLQTPFEETNPMFSPDGRWIAYRSNESGSYEIYVRPFPARSGKWLVSTGGGLYQIWSNNGRELFYQTLDHHIMALDYVVNGDTFVPGKPRVWSERKIYSSGFTTNWALAPDGKRFAVFLPPEATGAETGSVHVTFLLNFFDDLRRRLPPI